MSYDEALVVTRARSRSTAAARRRSRAGEVIYLSPDTPVVYRAIEDSEVVYVSYPHWYDATVRSPTRPASRSSWRNERGSDGPRLRGAPAPTSG